MKMVFVDTNYFLRFLLADVDAQHLKTKELFKKGLTREVELITSVIVFFEIYWVLSSFYGKKKEALVVILEDLLKMSFIKWEERQRLVKSVEIFRESGIDLEDSYNLVFSKEKKIGEMASFDKKLMKMFSG
jgi:predicted nucleic acid-binding protein